MNCWKCCKKSIDGVRAMRTHFRDAIAAQYGLQELRITAAPRQFVAETYRIQTPGGQTYFCKIIDKPTWIPKVIASLPALDAIHQLGFQRANYPIRTVTGALHVMVDATLIVLYNHIDAPLSEAFDDETFGRLVGEIHALTPQVQVAMPREQFVLKHRHLFEVQFAELLAANSADPIRQKLGQVLRQRETMIRQHYAALQRLCAACTDQPPRLVITHGDAGGNVLMRAPTDLYIVDWDEILLAPAERDLWIHDQNPAFMRGYRQVMPQYQVNVLARAYCLCSQHFDYMAYYLTEIISDAADTYRSAKLSEFATYFEGWIKPFLMQIE
jgi:thiamine kinase-like enzyme